MRKPGGQNAGWLAVLLACSCSAAVTSTVPTASPASLSFTYQVNSSTFPAAAKVTVTLPTSIKNLPVSVAVASAPQGWLMATPDTGSSPLALSVTVNPTSLAPGNYVGTITADAVPATGNPAVVSVTLTVANPPATLVVTSSSASYTPPASGTTTGTLDLVYLTGAASPIPASVELDVASTGELIPFNVTAASASSATGKSGTGTGWLRVSGSGQLAGVQTSGAALSGSQLPITVTLDMTTMATLDPGKYSGTITMTATNAVNGTFTVTVNLVVSAGPPTLRTPFPIFPDSVVAGPTVDPVITIYGDNFFASSVVTLQQGVTAPITLTCVLLSRKILQATVKAAYLAAAPSATYPVLWTLSVLNPAQAAVTTLFAVTDPSQPAITALVNAASYLPTAIQTGTAANPVPVGAVSVAPREIISIFGKNLGPAAAATANPTGTPPVYPTILGPVQVVFQIGIPPRIVYAPILMTASNQINCIVPVEAAATVGAGVSQMTVQVINGTASTRAFPLTAVAEDPGIFSFTGGGQGQSAVLNYDSAAGSYAVNSSKTAAARGSAISIYATGLGDLANSITLPTGVVAAAAVNLADSTIRVDIDGQPAVITYAGTSPGAVAGLAQVNAVVPPTAHTGAAIPITISAGSATTSRRSQPGLTLAVK